MQAQARAGPLAPHAVRAPSGLLGEDALKRRLLPQLRLFRVDSPVTGFTPSATLHSACTRHQAQGARVWFGQGGGGIA